jgi:hypothetical protein
MIPELNKNEFLKLRRALNDAKELHEGGHDKSAIHVLKPAIALAQKSRTPTRMLALLHYQRALSYHDLHSADKELKDLLFALEILEAIGDDSNLVQEIRKKINLLR